MSVPKPANLVDRKLLNFYYYPQVRIDYLEALGLIPATMREFMDYTGSLVEPIQNIIRSTAWDRFGRPVSYYREGRGGRHIVDYDNERFTIKSLTKIYTLDYDFNLLSVNDGKIIRQYIGFEPDGEQEIKLMDATTGHVIKHRVHRATETPTGRIIREHAPDPDGDLHPTSRYALVQYNADRTIKVYTRYEGSRVLVKHVTRNGRRAYQYENTHLDTVAKASTYQYDDHGRLIEAITPTHANWWKYSTDNKGRVKTIEQTKFNERTQDAIYSEIIFMR